jgi:hypothetical protein
MKGAARHPCSGVRAVFGRAASGRIGVLEFSARLATAFGVMGAPDNCAMEFTAAMAGRGGRNGEMEFIVRLATAV